MIRAWILSALALFEDAMDATPRLPRTLLRRLSPQHDLLEPEPEEAMTVMVDREKRCSIRLWGGAVSLQRLQEVEQILLAGLHSIRQQVAAGKLAEEPPAPPPPTPIKAKRKA